MILYVVYVGIEIRFYSKKKIIMINIDGEQCQKKNQEKFENMTCFVKHREHGKRLNFLELAMAYIVM